MKSLDATLISLLLELILPSNYPISQTVMGGVAKWVIVQKRPA
jgi:hypothetical protein